MTVTFDTLQWRYASDVCYFAIHQESGSGFSDDLLQGDDTLEVSLRVTEVDLNDIMPAGLKAMHKIYNDVYAKFLPNSMSQKERMELATQNMDKQEFTYGEVVFEHYVPMMQLMKPKQGEVFWDIGCGGAKPVAIAAMVYPELKASKGIEYLPQLAKLGKDALTYMQ